MKQTDKRRKLIAALAVAAATLSMGTVLQAQGDLEAIRQAAERGDADAQFALGVRNSEGRGVPQDDVEAARWFREAAEQDHADAQYVLGARYALGQGVPQDDAQAVLWLRRAAEQDHVFAQVDLGYMYTLGQGVSQDDVEAARWFRRAAEQGHAEAQTELDRLLAADPADDQAGGLIIPTPVQIPPSPGSLTQSQPERRRSWPRTVGGASLLFFGAVFASGAVVAPTCDPLRPWRYCVDASYRAGFGLLGGGLLALGGLLVTRWSDVPANSAIDFTVAPGRVQIGKTFGF